MKLTYLILLSEDPNQGLSDLLEKHWYIKERFDKALQERDYVDFKNCVLRGKVSHRTLASIIGEEELLRQVNGWNPGNWNWHTMKVFSERRAHPYQRERVRAPHYQREERAHPYQRVEPVDRGVGGSRTIGQRLDRVQSLMKELEKELN